MVRKAFLVGINDYAPIGPSEHDLHGCVEDAKDMANTLVIAGFPATSIRLCTNSRATKKGIMDGLDWLIKGTEKGDSLVFYYSGHGSQVPNIDLSGDDVEIDRMDEILCPHDLDFARQIYVKDDDLRAIFKKLSAGVNLEVILDSCHSGTATREILDPLKPADGNGIINNGVIKRSRYIEPPIEYTFHKMIPFRFFIR